jgi:hypothetical protein
MLNFDTLPKLPQVGSLVDLSEKLWTMPDVKALWLGGSFARGNTDQYSDFDLRIAVEPEAIESWRSPDFSSLFDNRYLDHCNVMSGPDAVLYQVMLDNGVLFDLWIQKTSLKPPADHVLLIGCRDDCFGSQLVSGTPEGVHVPPIADPETVRQIIVDFWIGTYKHVKVLGRSLDGLAQIGVSIERSTLMRLWYILATGKDSGIGRPTIHSLSAAIRAIESKIGESALSISGAPTRNRAEIIAAIDLNRNEVSRVGNLLAEQLNFQYPQKLESSIRSQWADFLKS